MIFKADKVACVLIRIKILTNQRFKEFIIFVSFDYIIVYLYFVVKGIIILVYFSPV